MATTGTDVVVIGGGIYGCMAALQSSQRGYHTTLLERNDSLLGEASWYNQARIHNGYHYPRSLRTAARSHAHYQRFQQDFPEAVYPFDAYYAIANHASRVTTLQFERLCQIIDLPLTKVQNNELADPQYVENLWKVDEYAFNATILREIITERIAQSAVDCRLQTTAQTLEQHGNQGVVVTETETFTAPLILNCTYAQLHFWHPQPTVPLLYELAEICLVTVPDAFEQQGITVMDGPFFSCIPFPGKPGVHSLTHVRYTPHMVAEQTFDPSLLRNPPPSRFSHMQQAAARISPWIQQVELQESLFVVKVVPQGRDRDDARPIILQRDSQTPSIVSVLGSKLDTVYDFMHWLENTLI